MAQDPGGPVGTAVKSTSGRICLGKDTQTSFLRGCCKERPDMDIHVGIVRNWH